MQALGTHRVVKKMFGAACYRLCAAFGYLSIDHALVIAQQNCSLQYNIMWFSIHPLPTALAKALYIYISLYIYIDRNQSSVPITWFQGIGAELGAQIAVPITRHENQTFRSD